MPGTNGLTHTESQTRWNQYKAAFITSGSWLENEQLKQTPEDFDMKFLPMPVLPGSKLPFEAIRAGAGEPFIVPEKAKNKAAGQEFLRSMLSKEWSTIFAQQANSLTILKDGVDPNVQLRPGTKSAVDAREGGGRQHLQLPATPTGTARWTPTSRTRPTSSWPSESSRRNGSSGPRQRSTRRRRTRTPRTTTATEQPHPAAPRNTRDRTPCEKGSTGSSQGFFWHPWRCI